jgi:hypothetical protein
LEITLFCESLRGLEREYLYIYKTHIPEELRQNAELYISSIVKEKIFAAFNTSREKKNMPSTISPSNFSLPVCAKTVCSKSVSKIINLKLFFNNIVISLTTKVVFLCFLTQEKTANYSIIV